jgi:choline dehydrogenase-like flavoprotein
MGSVVDASGSVYGVERLSVVDASIMPDVPSGFTHIPTIMIAERISDHIASRI